MGTPHPIERSQTVVACDEAYACLRDVWREAGKWTVGRYVLMPDHAHPFCAPHDVDFPLDAWVRFWKGQFTRRSTRLEWRQAIAGRIGSAVSSPSHRLPREIV